MWMKHCDSELRCNSMDWPSFFIVSFPPNMSHTVDILVSSPKWYTRLPASSLTCLLEDTHCIHDQRPSLQIKSPKAPASFNRKGFIDHYSRMSYHLRKRCDQESTKENHSTSHLKRRTKRITRQQQNGSFNLNFYKELRRSLVKETVQETHECIQPSTTDNVVSSQRCNAKNTGIRQRRTRDWKLDFTIPLEYQYASLDIDSADNEFYRLPEWLPNMDRVDQVMLELKIGHQGELCAIVHLISTQYHNRNM